MGLGKWSGLGSWGSNAITEPVVTPITPLTPEQWLQKPNLARVLLAQVNYLNSGLKSKWFSTHPFQSLPTDTPANTPFIDSILTSPIFSRRMGIFTGKTNATRSDVSVFNNADLNDLISGNVFNQTVKYYIGDETWSFADFIEIGEQRAESITQNNDELRINMRDPSLKLDSVIDTGTFSTGVSAGKAKPLCVGSAFNIEPILEDAPTHKYCVNYGPVNDVNDVRDNGVSVAFTKNNTDGSFTLNQAPVGKITCDVQGAKPTTYLQYPGEIITWLLTTFAGETNIADLSSLPNYLIGLYQKEPKSVRSLIDTICNSINAYHFYSRQGQFVANVMPTITGAATAVLTLDDVVEDGVRVRKTILPVSKVVVNYKQNYTEQSGSLAGSLDVTTREKYSVIYSVVESVNTLPDYPNAQPMEINTCLVNQVDAQAVADSKALIASVPRTIFEVSALGIPFTFELGQELELNYWDFGFINGQNGIITALDDNPIDGEVTVELWR